MLGNDSGSNRKRRSGRGSVFSKLPRMSFGARFAQKLKSFVSRSNRRSDDSNEHDEKFRRSVALDYSDSSRRTVSLPLGFNSNNHNKKRKSLRFSLRKSISLTPTRVPEVNIINFAELETVYDFMGIGRGVVGGTSVDTSSSSNGPTTTPHTDQSFEVRHLCQLIKQSAPKELLLEVLSFVPVNLQRYDLSPFKDKEFLMSHLIRTLFGYFANDANRTIFCLFTTLRGQLTQPNKYAPLSLPKLAQSIQYTNQYSVGGSYDLTQNNLRYVSFMLSNTKNYDNNWIKNELQDAEKWIGLQSLHINSSHILRDDIFYNILETCTMLKCLEASISFKSNSDMATEPICISDFNDNSSLSGTGHAHLRSLVLSVHNLNDSIMRSLLSNKQLRTLKIECRSYVSTSFEISSAIFRLLLDLHHLTTLHLSGVTGLDLYGCDYLIKCQSLRSLSLRHCALTDECVSKILQEISTLQILDISYNKLTYQSFADIAKANLIELAIIDVPLNEPILESLSSCTTLKRLTMSDTKLTDGHIKLLFDYRLNLTHFAIVGPNSLTNNGLRFIRDGTQNLEYLSICVNDRITHRGMQFLAEHSTLKTLDVTVKNSHPTSIPGIEELFSSKSIETLKLNNIKITFDDISHFSLSENKNSILQNLYMPCCEMDNKIAEAIFSYCTNLCTLTISTSRNISLMEEWSYQVGSCIARLSSTIQELYIGSDRDTRDPLIWHRVLFHLIPSLQGVYPLV